MFPQQTLATGTLQISIRCALVTLVAAVVHSFKTVAKTFAKAMRCHHNTHWRFFKICLPFSVTTSDGTVRNQNKSWRRAGLGMHTNLKTWVLCGKGRPKISLSSKPRHVIMKWKNTPSCCLSFFNHHVSARSVGHGFALNHE